MEEFLDKLPSMDLMRSEKMTLVQPIIPVESAHRSITYLGELGLLQFRHLNADKSPFQRTFANQVKRCGEMSRKLCFFKDQIDKAGLRSLPGHELEPDIELENLERQLADHEHELLEMNSNSEKLRQTYNELLEFKIVLEKAGIFLVSSNAHAVGEGTELHENTFTNNGFADTTSLIEQEMRGNMLFNQAPADEEIMDPATSQMVEKTVFVVFFSGEQARTKILKICEAFGANCYPVPEDMTKQRQLTREVLSSLSDLEVTLDAGTRHRNNALTYFCRVPLD